MAIGDITNAFIKHFGADVHVAYQRMGSKIRNTVRARHGIRAEDSTFQRVCKGKATDKQRNGMITPMNLGHDKVTATLFDRYAGEWVDDLDLLKTNIDEHALVTQGIASAFGRETDQILFDAIKDTGNHTDYTPGGTNTAVTPATVTTDASWATNLMQRFGEAEIPDDGQRYVMVPHSLWARMLGIKEFASADYIGYEQLPFKGGMTAKRWLGFMWYSHSMTLENLGTETGNAGDEPFVAYHKSAWGHVIGKDVTDIRIQYYNTHWSNFISGAMSMGAVAVDPVGIILGYYDIT